MLRLVTQFDDPRARPVVATPTCTACCSCCCCCCLAATITTATYTAMNLGATARRAGLPEPHVRGFVRLGALTFILAPTTIAVIVLLAWIFGSVSGFDDQLVVLPLFAASWPLCLFGLYRNAGHERPWRPALGTWIAGAVLFALEIAWGVFTIVHLGTGYLLVAALATIGGIVVSRALTSD